MSKEFLQIDLNERAMNQFLTAFTSVAAERAARNRNKRHVSRQSPNPSRRKGPAEGPGRIQAGDRREVRGAILYHFSGWACCPGISLRGVGADRAEAGGALQFQPDEEKVSDAHQLLRPA